MDERVPVDCLAKAQALAPVIAAAVPRIEANRELPADLVDALHEARLFRMLLPRSLDGDEVSPVTFLRTIEEIAKADAATAWCVAQTSVCSTIAKALRRETAEDMFLDPRGVLAWGPTHMSSKAIATDGGYRVTGTWPFASGSRHATWLAAHCRLFEADGAPRLSANGEHEEITLVVPRSTAEIKDVWHVIGLKGTGSDTYSLNDVFIPTHRSIAYHALDPSEWLEHGALYSFNIYQLFGSAFPAIALGIARAMLDSFEKVAKTKMPAHTTTLLRESAVVQSQVGVAEAQWNAAHTFLFSAWEDIWQAAQGKTVTLEQRVRLRMASIHAAQQARQVADTSYLAAGTLAVLASNPFERRFRDMHAVSQQSQSQFAIYETVGRYFLDLPVNPRQI
ncbi:MAG TPA: acyl-CoA dehydrogenase family protein [Xanthobacteraceae bacterium]|jgi:alkylation response protein AidB-like acyl-CoA dehydrogenase|nr:acyl-CoA dehydrogenase family protein [Xanthobacteraceae bacterium]